MFVRYLARLAAMRRLPNERSVLREAGVPEAEHAAAKTAALEARTAVCEAFQSAGLAAAVTAGGVRNGPPGQGGELSMQVELVAFYGQDPACAAFGEVSDVLALAAQRVRGDHGVSRRSPIWSSSGRNRVISLVLSSPSVSARTTAVT
ncbi:hypothetical protein ACIOFV_42565 [Streptomyces mirabilis]|uniref:hypothetical protein n=1 Tax=Streptomyces mirabilis TaxID=68239 RepID=UPI003829E0E5